MQINGTLAQLVEQRTENPCVPGSIPGGTTLIPYLQLIRDFRFYLFFLAAIKLLTKKIIDNVEVKIIIITLIKPTPALSIDLGNLMPTNAININNVRSTAI